MKILFLTPWYPDDKNPNHGIFVRDQAVALQRAHEVIVISAKVDYSTFALFSYAIKESDFRGVREYRISVKRSIPFLNQLVFFYIVTRQAVRISKKNPPDIVHGNIGYPGAFWSWLVSKIIGKPYVVTEHTSRFTANFRSFIHKILTVYSLKRARAIISVSNHSAAEILVFIGRKAVVIPNIIDFEKFTELSVPKTKVWQIGFLGNLNTNTKGLDILLKALSGISNEFKLHIGGSGNLLDDYKQLARQLKIEDKCIFYGFVAHNEVPAFMKQLHFFVSASRFESFGMVIVEAMACGLPVVAAASGGPADFINSSNGILVEKENAKALRLGIETIIQNYQTYDPTRIRKFTLEKYSAAKFLERSDELYRSVMKYRAESEQ